MAGRVVAAERARKSVEIANRRQRVLDLIIVGVPYRQIAVQLGISLGQVSIDKTSALKEQLAPAAEAVKEMHVARAEWLWARAAKAVLDNANTPQVLPAIAQAIRARESLAKLQGVDTALEIHVQYESVIDAEIRRLEESLAITPRDHPAAVNGGETPLPA